MLLPLFVFSSAHVITCTADGVCVSSDGCSVGTCTAAAAGTGCTFSQRGCNPVANGVNSCVTGDTCYPGGCKLTCIDGYAPSSDGTRCELYCGSATYTLTPPATSPYYYSSCNVCGSHPWVGYDAGSSEQYLIRDTLLVGQTVKKIQLTLHGTCSSSYNLSINGASVATGVTQFGTQCFCNDCYTATSPPITSGFIYRTGAVNSFTVSESNFFGLVYSSIDVTVSTCV